MEFPGALKKKTGNSKGQLKRGEISTGDQKKSHVEFPPWVLVFGLGISKECHTILSSSGETSFCLEF